MKHFGAVVGFALAFDEARSRWETSGEQSRCRGGRTKLASASPARRHAGSHVGTCQHRTSESVSVARRNASVSPAPQRDHLTLQTLKANERIVPTEPSAMSSMSGRPPLPVTELSAYSVPFGAVK